MATPTEAELNTQLQNAVRLLDNFLEGQTVIADEDTYVQSLESDFANAQANGARLFRTRVATAVSSAQSVLTPVLSAYSHHIVGTPERAAQAALDRIYDFFIANARTVQSRDITYGAIPSFGVGKGVLLRLTVDENAFDLENEFVEAKVLRCIRDENTGGVRHEETFEIRGDNAGVDSLDASGSGSVARNFSASSSRQSLARNPTFSQFSIAGAFAGGIYDMVSGDSITGWTVSTGAIADFRLDRNDFARDPIGDANPTSVVFKDNAKLTQAFSVNNLQLNASIPFLPEVFVLADTGLTAGTLTMRWGTKSTSVDLSTLTIGVWTRLVPTINEDLWVASFNEADADFELEVTGLTGGNVKVDEFTFSTFFAFDGTWWYLSGAPDGSPTTTESKFLLDDTITVTDTFTATDSKIQKFLWRAYGRYLPHAAVPTLADPV